MTKYSLTQFYLNLKIIQAEIRKGNWRTNPILRKMTIEEIEDIEKTITILENRKYSKNIPVSVD